MDLLQSHIQEGGKLQTVARGWIGQQWLWWIETPQGSLHYPEEKLFSNEDNKLWLSFATRGFDAPPCDSTVFYWSTSIIMFQGRAVGHMTQALLSMH